MKRLRIAMFSDSSLPTLNGVSISIDALVNELREQGHSVHLYFARHPRHKDSDPNTYRFPSLPCPWAVQYPIAAPPFHRILSKFRRNEYDVIHTHTPFILGMVGLRWSESHDLPIVSTYHTLYDRYAHYGALVPRRYIRFRIAKHTNFYYNSVDHVITPSHASLKWLQRHSVETPATVIPTGSPKRRFINRSEARQEFGISPEAKIMLYVGRLAKEKNLDTLIEMASIAMNQDPTLRLWLVGDGPYRTELAAIVRRLRIGDRVKFVGFVPRQDVDTFYAASDIFVFPSITETQGLVVQEAMTYGLPALAIAGGGAGAAIVDGVNGYVVRNHAGVFAETLLSVIRNQEVFDRLSDGASKSMRTNSIEEMAESVVNVYNHAIKQRNGLLPSAADLKSWIL